MANYLYIPLGRRRSRGSFGSRHIGGGIEIAGKSKGENEAEGRDDEDL